MYSQFATLAAISAIARLVSYIATCLAVPALRRSMPDAQRLFTVPGGAAIPIVAVALSVWLLFGSSRQQITISGAVLLAGAAMYAIARRSVANSGS
jgi:amino acid transporter